MACLLGVRFLKRWTLLGVAFLWGLVHPRSEVSDDPAGKRPGKLFPSGPALDDDLVLALNQAARIVPGGYVAEPNVARQAAEERNSLSNEHWHSSDDEALNGPRTQEPLNGDAAVDVQVVDPTNGKLGNNLSGRSAHLFHNATAHCGQIDGAAAQDHDALVTVRPRIKSQNRLESLSADHNGIDAGYKLFVAVRFAAALRQKVESTVRPRNEPVDARADKDRYAHRRLLTGGRLTINSNRFSHQHHAIDRCRLAVPQHPNGFFGSLTTGFPRLRMPFIRRLVRDRASSCALSVLSKI